jgi:2,3-bisphosphoglycerate-dependent phosphoglycerate mutase
MNKASLSSFKSLVGRVILIRHGESIWNSTDPSRGLLMRFTGWADVPMTELGVQQARHAGHILQSWSIVPDVICTSLLTRSVHSYHELAKSLTPEVLNKVTVIKSWRLNERHYGALVGLSKEQVAIDHGAEQAHAWRKSWNIKPPHGLLMYPEYANEYCHSANTYIENYSSAQRYVIREKHVTMPSTESLEDCCMRVLPMWHNAIEPYIIAGKTVVIVAHANTIRALIKFIDHDTLSSKNLQSVKIPAGIPLIYAFGLSADNNAVLSLGAFVDNSCSGSSSSVTNADIFGGSSSNSSKIPCVSEIEELNIKGRDLGITGTFLEEFKEPNDWDVIQ